MKKEKIIMRYNRAASDSMGASLSGKNANIIFTSVLLLVIAFAQDAVG